MAQISQSICFFIIPSLIFAFFCQDNLKTYLKIDDSYNVILLILSVCLIFVIQPVIDFMGYYNQQVILPDSMSAIEQWMKENEFASEKTTNLLFSDKTIIGLIFNWLIIAVLAGLAEELFFRGCMQQIIQKIVINQHVAVWIGALIFSAMHFQFYGFVPRLLLGAVLGYLFVWSGSIWLPVIIHTVNNTIGVVLAFLYYGTPQYNDVGTFTLDNNLWITILSIVLSAIILFIIYKKRKEMLS
jgi:membrane protease YdiL (CAAX protease family)